MLFKQKIFFKSLLVSKLFKFILTIYFYSKIEIVINVFYGSYLSIPVIINIHITHCLLEGLQDGFLSVLGEHAFHGSFGDAHNYGDVADDMIGIFEWNATSYAYEWYVPTLDLVEIYNDYYGIEENPITEDLINECAGMLLIGRLGEHIIGRSVYNYYVKKAPIMLDMFR